MDNMTILSQQQFECALKISSIKEAAEALQNYKHFRTLGDVLSTFCDDPNVKKILVDGLLDWFPESNREAVDRKVRNWLASRSQKIDKETAFILAHVLGLTLDKANDFLKMAVGEGIHWRDPEDIIWSYSILHRLKSNKTRDLLDGLSLFYKSSDCKKPNVASGYTMEVYEKLQPVLFGAEDGLLNFIEAEQENLGTFHNTAYQTFIQFMKLLEDGFTSSDIEKQFREMTQAEKKKKESEAADRKETARKEAAAAGIPFGKEEEMTLSDLDGDTELYQPERLTTRDVLETYLYRSLVPAKEDKNTQKTDSFFAIRHSIRQNWPDEFTLSRMKNRQVDISRKVLLLLFLATDGSNSEFSDDFLVDDFDEELSKEDAFLDIYTRLNLMLTSCGFLKLDPRSAFDWMVLFCISTGDLWESDERIQAMLLEIFPMEN